MGAVFEGFDPVLGRRVAVKVLRLDLFEQPNLSDVRARFQREAQAAGQLAHPNIVTIYDYGEHEGAPYIAMEYIEGQDLGKLLANGLRLPIAETVRLMTQLLSALSYAHAKKVVHRDIKPANIFVSSQGNLKIVDFGLAHVEASSLTDSGTLLGTPAYMSPEQFLALPIDERSDLFSVGVVLYELLTGDKPFTGSVTTIMQKVLHQQPMEPSVLNPTLSKAWDTAVRRAMAKKSTDRYQSAKQFSETIQQIQEKRAEHVSEEVTLTGNYAEIDVAGSPRPPSLVPSISSEGKPFLSVKKLRHISLLLSAATVVSLLFIAANRHTSPTPAVTRSVAETQEVGPSASMTPCPGQFDATTWNHCRGEVRSSNGSRYVGAFKNGEFNGYGTLIYSDGRKYVGGWRNGQMHGKGTDTYPDGSNYVGEFSNDVRFGQGTFTWPDGASYAGGFKDGSFNWQGTLLRTDGSRFVGEFRDGERFGRGIEYGVDGSIVRSGIWERGVFVGKEIPRRK